MTLHHNATSLHWQCARLDAFSTAQLYAIFAARSEVFVVEQHCAYQDLDGADAECLHVVGWSDSDNGKPIVAAYLRIAPPGLKYAEASVGRVITTKNFRGNGTGKTLIAQGLMYLDKHYPNQAIRISAQAYLEKFYAGFGFVVVSEIYLEDDIPHVEMLRVITPDDKAH